VFKSNDHAKLDVYLNNGGIVCNNAIRIAIQSLDKTNTFVRRLYQEYKSRYRIYLDPRLLANNHNCSSEPYVRIIDDMFQKISNPIKCQIVPIDTDMLNGYFDLACKHNYAKLALWFKNKILKRQSDFTFKNNDYSQYIIKRVFI